MPERFFWLADDAHGIAVIPDDIGIAAGERKRDLVLAKRLTHLQLERIREPERGMRDRQVRRDGQRDFRILQRLIPALGQLGGRACGLLARLLATKDFIA